MSEQIVNSAELVKEIYIEKNNFNDEAFKKANFSSSFCCLLRPDNYIGYIAEMFSPDEFNNYMQSLINKSD